MAAKVKQVAMSSGGTEFNATNMLVSNNRNSASFADNARACRAAKRNISQNVKT